jgi:hypothetical protein
MSYFILKEMEKDKETELEGCLYYEELEPKKIVLNSAGIVIKGLFRVPLKSGDFVLASHEGHDGSMVSLIVNVCHKDVIYINLGN